jgi:hypothetical protein
LIFFVITDGIESLTTVGGDSGTVGNGSNSGCGNGGGVVVAIIDVVVVDVIVDEDMSLVPVMFEFSREAEIGTITVSDLIDGGECTLLGLGSSAKRDEIEDDEEETGEGEVGKRGQSFDCGDKFVGGFCLTMSHNRGRFKGS